MQSAVHVYWERQGSDKLCGVNCVNSLLQGPFFNEIILADIALELDSAEKELMAAQGVESKDFLRYLAQESNNVADDGNYSIQVLGKALEERFGLHIESVDARVNKNEDLSFETGFICNSSCHWFTIRKVQGIWLNLNSTNRKGPEIVSDFYLSAFLNAVKENGYTIFVVKGDFPQTSKASFPDLNKNQKWFTFQEVQEIHTKNLADKNFKLNIGGTDERDLEEAIKNSLDDMKEKENPQKPAGDSKEKPSGPSYFGGVGVKTDSSGMTKQKIKGYEKYNINYENDPEMAFVFKLSLGAVATPYRKFDVPLDPATAVKINFKYPNGKGKIREFPMQGSTVEDLYDFVKYDNEENFDFYLFSTYPKVTYDDLSKSFEEAGVGDLQTVFVSRLG